MASTRRLEELSVLNVLFCLMVAFYHITSQTAASLDHLSWQFALTVFLQRTTCISLPGFFFLSGLKLTLPSPGREKPLSQYYRGRAGRLLVPYVLAAAVHYLVFVILGWYPFSVTDFLQQTALGTLSAQFYFVVVLAQFILLAPVFRAIPRRWPPVILLPVSLVLTQLSGPFFSHVAQHFPVLSPCTRLAFPNFLFYYLAGCCAGTYYENFRTMLVKNRSLIVPMALCFTCADQLACFLHYSGRSTIPYLESLHLLYYISGILLLCSWPATVWTGSAGRLLHAVDRASYLIYLYHCLVITLFNAWAPRQGITNAGVQFLLRTAVTYGVTIGGCVGWQWLWRTVTRAHSN